MNYIECNTSELVRRYCDEFWVAMQARNDKAAMDDAESMFNSIKGAAATAGSQIGRKMGGAIWVAVDEQDTAVGLMRLKKEGDIYHLLNLVGVPKAGGGAALLDLAKAIALSEKSPLKLEAADEKLIGYYKERCFTPTTGKVMVYNEPPAGR